MGLKEPPELHWIRAQIRAIQHHRLYGARFTEQDRIRYEVLCRREAELLQRVRRGPGTGRPPTPSVHY
ncbi:MAG TPA: hypothetical protein DCQ30_01610 [Acidimicrobiaceae bacterium]|nr:hypothetical protein [Acidimicrobiaceae bacterium]